jgi:hypothetical protein
VQITNPLFVYPQVKINHKSLGSYMFILEVGAAANSKFLLTSVTFHLGQSRGRYGSRYIERVRVPAYRGYFSPLLIQR